MRSAKFSSGERVKVDPQDEDDPVAIFMRDAVFTVVQTVVQTRYTPSGSKLVLVEGTNRERLMFRAQDLRHES